MPSSLEAIRQQLDQVIQEASADLDQQAAERAAALDRREAELARAMELATVDARVRAAWLEAARAERRRLQVLIIAELHRAAPLTPWRSSLLRLGRMVEQGE